MQMRWAFILLLIFSGLGLAQDVKISASVDKNPVAVGQQFVLEFEVSGNSQNLPDIDFPDFSDFRVLSGPNTSSSYQIINFKMSASKTYSFYLMPRKAGKFKIGPAGAKYKGKTIRSNVISLEVVKGQGKGNASTPRGQNNRQNTTENNLGNSVLVRVVPSKRTVYVNEEITLQYKIYFNVNIQGNEIVKTPEAAGCWMEDYPTPQRPRVYQEVLNGKSYNVALIRKIAVFPSKSGEITISPLEMLVETVVRSKRRRSRSLFDDFFNDPFGQTVTNQISSGPLKIKVLPLPGQGKPAGFSGLVGNFQLHAAVDKQQVQTNEAVSYKVKINGSGMLNTLNQLPLQFSPDFEVYEPKIQQSMNKKGARIASSKEFEYVLIPRVAGEQEIKAAKIWFFNPANKSYQAMKIPAFKLQVAQGEETGLSLGSGTTLSKKEVKLLGKDIRYIHEKVPGFYVIHSMPYHYWQFYAAFILPLLLFAGAFVYRQNRDKMATNVEFARSKKARKQAQARLKEASKHLRGNHPAEFYAAVSSALLGFVADKSNRAAAGMVLEDIQKIFEQRKVDAELAASYFQCLDEADFKRFAPAADSESGAEAFYKKAEQLLTQLAKFF